MSGQIVKVVKANFITHDVKRFVVEKPAGYTFIPGQATDVAINLPEWKDKLRPFTFTSLNTWQHLEFVIKIYADHPGVTNMLGRTNAGAELILHEPFGAIQYKGKGIFIAGGAGITPFLAIFRDLFRKKQLKGNRLIYSNKTSQDVIMDEELRDMLKGDYMNVYTRENVIGFLDRRIDREFLIKNIDDFGQYFYLCGPEKFVTDLKTLLTNLGANPESLIIEK
jgi:ferredoxin-NADP reductase